MANYIVSYDLNGPQPSHKQVDELLAELGATRARVLETVWYVGWEGALDVLFESLDSLLGGEDSLMVVSAQEGTWRNLLVDDKALAVSWGQNR